MQVVCLNPYLPPPTGGIEKEMLALASELVARGHPTTVVTSTARFPRGENVVAGELPEGVATRRLRGYVRGTLRGFAPARAPLWIPGLRRTVASLEPELVLVFNIGWGPPLRPVLRWLGGRCPVLYRTYFHPPGGRLAEAKRRYLAATVALADRALVPTTAEGRALAAIGPLPGERIVEVPPGVHLHPVRPERVAEVRRALDLEGRTVIAHVARLSEFKGTLDLVDALPEVRRLSGQDVVLLLIGQDQLGERLAERATSRGVAGCLRLTGEVSDDRELQTLLRAATLFALPSEYEAFGIAFIEAQAASLACVGCDVGGSAAAIGEAGILLPRFGDQEALVRALVDLIADPQRRRQMGEKGRERVERSLTWGHTAERILAVASDVRDAGRAGRR